MRFLLFLLALAGATVALDMRSAVAREYPVCIRMAFDYEDCTFASIDQCRATASGTGAGCYVNSRYVDSAPASRSTRQRREIR